MENVLMRLALFTALPVLLGAALVIFDRTATGAVRRAEAFLVPLFLVGVGGSGVSGFIANELISDPAARAIGWEPGSPFQRVVGFANLAIGLLGAVAAERRDGLREATVVAATVFGVGLAVVHAMQAVAAGGPSVVNVLQIVASVAQPVLLIWFLLGLRRAEDADPSTIILRGWMIPVRRGSVAAVGIAATAFSLGHSTGQVVVLSLAGMAVAGAMFWWVVRRATTHRAKD